MSKRKRVSRALAASELTTIKSYDLEAERQFREEPAVGADDVFRSVRALMCNDPLFLDVGCGHGRVIPALREMGIKRYVGIDLSEGMLEVARREYPDTDIRKMNLFDLPQHFPENHFDAFFALNILFHVPRKRMIRGLKAIRKVVRKGGVGAVSMIAGSGSVRVANHQAVDERYTGPTATMHLWTLEELSPVLNKAGFSIHQDVYWYGLGIYLIAVRAE